MSELFANRRDLLIAPLLAALPLALTNGAGASKIDPAQTIVRLPEAIEWKTPPGFAAGSIDQATLYGATTEPGLYYVLVRWHPGYMSAPHTYVTDRLCVVVSGIWWVNSGADFDPANTIPAPAGTFVRRVAGTPHYDGVIRTGTEPAVIAICGMGPVGLKFIEAGKPAWREV
jgi:hypothetical protein